MMKLLFFLFLVFLILSSPGQGAKSGKTTKKTSSSVSSASNIGADFQGQERLKEIDKILRANRERNTIKLVDANFTKYITEKPRLYHAAIFMTATAKKYECMICKASIKEYRKVAKYYNENYPSLVNIQEKNRIVFFVLDVDSARNVFSSLSLETVPRMYIIPPNTKLDEAKQNFEDFEISNEVILEGKLMTEINRLTNIEIKMLWEPWPILCGLCVFSLVLAYLVDTISRAGEEALYWYRSPRIWMLVSFTAFSVGVSGTIYCIIRSAPLYGTGRDGKVELFSDESRDQYMLEGFAIAALVLGAAMSLILMHYSTKLPFAIARNVGVSVSIGLFITIGLSIWEAYGNKTSWYHLKDTLPAPAWHFISSSVKKNSWLPKRIYRLCEIFLSNEFDIFDASDWGLLQKKFKTLIIDYIVRVAGSLMGGSDAAMKTSSPVDKR